MYLVCIVNYSLKDNFITDIHIILQIMWSIYETEEKNSFLNFTIKLFVLNNIWIIHLYYLFEKFYYTSEFDSLSRL